MTLSDLYVTGADGCSTGLVCFTVDTERPAGVGVDDLLDAAVAAWTGLRIWQGMTARADCSSRLVNDFVKAAARTVERLRKPVQTQLQLSA